MSDVFTPLVPTSSATRSTSTAPLKVLSQAEAKSAFEPFVTGVKAEQSAKSCGPPTVTLQKQGEVVSGIRVQCSCGQVIELACAY